MSYFAFVWSNCESITYFLVFNVGLFNNIVILRVFFQIFNEKIQHFCWLVLKFHFRLTKQERYILLRKAFLNLNLTIN